MSSPIPAMNVTNATQDVSGMAPLPIALIERVRAVRKEARDEQAGSDEEQASAPQGVAVPMMMPPPSFVLHPATSMVGTGTSAPAPAAGASATRTQEMDGAPVSVSPSKKFHGRLPTVYPPTQRGTTAATGAAADEPRTAATHTPGPQAAARAGSAQQKLAQQVSASLQPLAMGGGERLAEHGSRRAASPTGAMSATTGAAVGPFSAPASLQASPQPTPAMQSSDTPTPTPTPTRTPGPAPQASSTLAGGDATEPSAMPVDGVVATPETRSMLKDAIPQTSAHGLMNPGMRPEQPAFQAAAQHGTGQPRPERQLPAAANGQAAVQRNASVTVPFSSWGPGHQVTASWVPGSLAGIAGAGVTLRGSSERVSSAVGVALESADPLNTSAWRIQPGDAADDSSGRRTPQRTPPEDDE